jgi:vesicle coat complex subunit
MRRPSPPLALVFVSTRPPSCLQACNTRDLVVKKMVYLFLCAHAQTNAELTLLAINTLQKDW